MTFSKQYSDIKHCSKPYPKYAVLMVRNTVEVVVDYLAAARTIRLSCRPS
jgi:hypothetical protein